MYAIAYCFWLSVAAAPTDVQHVMQNNFEALIKLQPYLVNSAQFADPANKKEIQKALWALTRTQHVFTPQSATQEAGLSAIMQLFSDNLTKSQKHFDERQFEQARSQLRAATAFCLACHTRIETTQHFKDTNQRVSRLKLNEIERADFYAATRQFESALRSYQEMLKRKPETEEDNFKWLHAARNALRISVRVNSDPSATEELLKPLMLRTDVPTFLKAYLENWQRDLDEWKNDKADTHESSPQELVAKARMLIGQIDGMLLYDVPDVRILRATGLLHEALSRAPTGPHRPEALFLLGLAYRGPQDPLLWQLDSLFFEACVRENPHSAVARQCFKRLQNEVFFDYTGSSGIHVPQDELDKIAALRKLAFD